MKLIHKSTGQEAKIGDTVFSRGTGKATLLVANQPHKPSSEGKVQVRWESNDQISHELYCSVFNLEWIEREDRQDDNDSVAMHEQLTEDYLSSRHHTAYVREQEATDKPFDWRSPDDDKHLQ